MKRPVLILLLLVTAFEGAFAGKPDKGLYCPDSGRKVRPRVEVLAVEAREGYECRLVEFSADDSYLSEGKRTVKEEERIKAYLLVPERASKGVKCPGIVMLHDHGARFDIGKEKLARPVAADAPEHIVRSSRQWIDRNFDGVYMADSLARLGYVVLVADALYWGSRSCADAQEWSRLNYSEDADPKASKARIRELKTIVYEGQRQVYDSLQRKGIIWAEKMLRDDAASVHMLRSLPYVDKRNIGAFGFSMGAHRCWMLAAFCKEVRCGVALSWITTLDGYEGNNASDLSMRIRPMRDAMDFGDIGIFLAPKPMLFLNGTSDRLFPQDKVQVAFGKLRKHYAERNRHRRSEPPFEPLQTVFFNGGHHCGKEQQKLIVEFFDANMKY